MRTPSWRKSSAIFLVSSLLAGCVGHLPALPPVPREAIDRVRVRVEAMVEASKPPEVPEAKEGPPPAVLECQQSAEDPSLWLCVGDPGRMGKGAGLFFAYDVSGEALRQALASERILRSLVPTLQERLEVRDRMLLTLLDMLDASAAMAGEYRLIAVVRGEEITRLQRDRVIDRITLFVPLAAIGAGIGYLFVK